MSPSERANEAFMGSPPMELTARRANCGAAFSMKTSAFRFGTN